MPPKKLLCIIPISTTGITQSLAAIYTSTTQVQLDFIDGRGLATCPPCIENHDQAVVSSVAMLPRVTDFLATRQFDGILTCCFSDHPLVYALRRQTSTPVMGIFQAALKMAVPTTETGNERFGIVTTTAAWEPVLQESVEELGYGAHCVGVCATRLGVLDLESLPESHVIEVFRRSAQELADAGATRIILGCAGMASLRRGIQAVLSSRVRIIDGVEAGIALLARE
ncbi:asp glu hydantoin racemase [Fusarium tjaetaba]|uniref:Asp glu hydantoin racemase n=1 Tax=Fusarium tjaetaba TaxID=1567544 RepID=A0A8H5V8H5_9HYPO|nr:asp glu hydantoin racemase [Fusarium tjaetaba]KAF5612740.1 asp glu hydantoin racemase [Fusarium tjaetaba]